MSSFALAYSAQPQTGWFLHVSVRTRQQDMVFLLATGKTEVVFPLVTNADHGREICNTFDSFINFRLGFPRPRETKDACSFLLSSSICLEPDVPKGTQKWGDCLVRSGRWYQSVIGSWSLYTNLHGPEQRVLILQMLTATVCVLSV